MISADCVVENCRRLLTCSGEIPKRKEALGDLGIIDRAWIASNRGRIVFVGREPDFRREVAPDRDALRIDAEGGVALPGFVDSHTHLPFAGNREDEFRLRTKGLSYRELAALGMGIQSTVRATRAVSKGELTAACLKRLDDMLAGGTTTLEAKSGYGLNLEDEIKQLEVLRDLGRLHPMTIVPTFMGAHEVPPEYRGKKEDYVDFLIGAVLPEVEKSGLAEFFDVYCEEGVFSLEDTRKLVRAAAGFGLQVKIHSDEFVPLGATELAAETGARSAEHLINITEDGIRRIAAGRTAAVLLPGVSFFLMLDKRAPARRLADAGAIVALASDYNPGSSMVSSMLFVLQLGVYTLKLSVEEAIAACTANGAYAAGREAEAGSLEAGKNMDLIIADVPDYPSLAYELGRNPIRHVLKKGRLVVRDKCLVPRASL